MLDNRSETPPTDGALTDLTTPALLLDRNKLQANVRRLSAHIGDLGGTLRPHVKTHKSIDVTQDILDAGNARGITVSTLKEAEYFFAHGVTDILYAVGISPNKFAKAADLLRQGCALQVILDTPEMAERLADFAAANAVRFPVLIELDTDGQRSGADPNGSALIETGRVLDAREGVALHGVMTHAGKSYSCNSQECLLEIARQERDLSVTAASRLRDAGLPCPVVSIGSTPTAFAIDDLSGVTEVRAGVYATFDLVMVGVGVCSADEIALSVLVTVTGHQRDKNWIITDGGWMAMSRDTGTSGQTVDYGYGAVADVTGRRVPELWMRSANQEHGIIAARNGDAIDFTQFPLGSQLRILPIHACATAAQHAEFHVLEDAKLTQIWSKASGW